MKPRSAGYGAPYPPISGANSSADRGFKQRVPDKQILEHDRRRAIEVKVMEERERLEEENERLEEEMGKSQNKSSSSSKSKSEKDEKAGGEEKEDGEEVEDEDEGQKVLSEEEIDERCEALRQRLLKELEEDKAGAGTGTGGRGKMAPPPRDRRMLKSYQVHELAEAKIEESERLRKALGIREDRETGEISSGRFERRRD